MKKITLIVVSCGLFISISKAATSEDIKNSAQDINKIDVEDIKKDGIDIIDINISIPIPDVNISIPTPDVDVDVNIPIPPHQHSAQEGRIVFYSNEFTFATDAEKSMEYAVSKLKQNNFLVIEANRNWNTYSLVFIPPYPVDIRRYDSQTYSFSSEAKRAMEKAVVAFESQGKIILEKNLQWNKFIIQYVEKRYYNYTPDYQPYPPYSPYP